VAKVVLEPFASCLIGLVVLAMIVGIMYWAVMEFKSPKQSDQSERIESLVNHSQSLVIQVGRFDGENWQDVVPEVRQLSSAIEADAYALREDDHWYKDEWAIAAIIAAAIAIFEQHEREKTEKKLKEMEDASSAL
jgi:uncharacterized membrane protein